MGLSRGSINPLGTVGNGSINKSWGLKPNMNALPFVHKTPFSLMMSTNSIKKSSNCIFFNVFIITYIMKFCLPSLLLLLLLQINTSSIRKEIEIEKGTTKYKTKENIIKKQ